MEIVFISFLYIYIYNIQLLNIQKDTNGVRINQKGIDMIKEYNEKNPFAENQLN